MQQWEYKFLIASWHDGWKIEMVNGETLTDWEYGLSMYDYLNQLGAQGWEIVSMQYFTSFNQEGHIPDEVYENYRIAMKRERGAASI